MWMGGLGPFVPPDRALGRAGTGRRGCLSAIRQEKHVSFVTTHLRRISGGRILETLTCEYFCLPGFFGFFMAIDAPASNNGGA